ncbi:hypothetical protein LguiA_015420 [Lonicera macranthoides]
MGFTSHNAKIHSESGLTKFTSQFHVGQTQDLPVTREDETVGIRPPCKDANVSSDSVSGPFRYKAFGIIACLFEGKSARQELKRQQGLVLCGLLSTTQDGPVDDAQKTKQILHLANQQNRFSINNIIFSQHHYRSPPEPHLFSTTTVSEIFSEFVGRIEAPADFWTVQFWFNGGKVRI